MQERTHRLIYAAETILIGAPSMTLCVPLLLMGLVVVLPTLFFTPQPPSPTDVIVLVGLMAAGVSGVLSWSVLSGNFLFGGRQALVSVGSIWWIALAAGAAGAFGMGVMMLSEGKWAKPLQWLTGPAMAVPAAHLFWLKYKYGRLHNQPRHPADQAVSDSRLSMNAPLPPGPRFPVPGPGAPSPESRVPSPGF